MATETLGTRTNPVNFDGFTTKLHSVHWAGVEFIRFGVAIDVNMTPATFTSGSPVPGTNTNDGLIDVGVYTPIEGGIPYGRLGFKFRYVTLPIQGVSTYQNGRWIGSGGGQQRISVPGFPHLVEAWDKTCYVWLFPVQLPVPPGQPWPMYLYAGWPFGTKFREIDGVGLGGTITDKRGNVVTEMGSAAQFPVSSGNKAFRTAGSLTLQSFGAVYGANDLNSYMGTWESLGGAGNIPPPDFFSDGVVINEKTIGLGSISVNYKDKPWRPIGVVVYNSFFSVICRRA